MLVGSAENSRWDDVGPANPMAGTDLDLGQARWLQVTFEATGKTPELFPPGLHPTIPVLTTMQFWDVTEGDLGPFRLAQVRLSCRAGVRMRALLLRCVVNNTEAARTLAEGWGFDPHPGEVDISWRTDLIAAKVTTNGTEVLSTSMKMPMVLDPEDLQHINNVNPAMVGNELRLLQVEPRIHNLQVQRGAAHLAHFDSEFWQVPNNAPAFGVIAATADVQLALPRVRFVQDPLKLAHVGTQLLQEAS
jgi:hypothetical protein